MMVELGASLLCLIFASRTAIAVGRLAGSAWTLRLSGPPEPATEAAPHILLVVPALREASVIAATLDHLTTLDYPSDRLSIAVAATLEPSGPDRPLTTTDAVRDWMARRRDPRVLITKYGGARKERAAQINHAVAMACAGPAADAEIIGIYDADSRPHPATLRWVAWNHAQGAACQQQVLHYLDAANDLARRGAPALCVANAVYQGSWSLTKEWPNLRRYRRHRMARRGPYPHSLYLNGHGQFLTRALYETIAGVPEGVVTDGIQLGYRLSLIGEAIAPIPVFCSDDVPATVGGLLEQHRRWFAGNIRFADACAWARGRGARVSAAAILDNILLNGSWALRLPLALLAAILVAFVEAGPLRTAMAVLLATTLVVYGIVLPMLAARVAGVSLKLRPADWLLLPAAAAFKSLGPLLYLFQVCRSGIDSTNQTLRKVER